MSESKPSPPPGGQFLVYRTEDGKLKIDVRFEGETVWLTQQHMTELFQTTKQNVSLHIQNIYEERELERGATVKESLTVQLEGNRSVQRRVEFYNLDVIISVGYRVKSLRGTQFRIWATQRLREYIVKGFVLDDERLKNPDLPFDYFEELTRRSQDIRTSERRFYQKITDLYATSIDYDPTQDISLTKWRRPKPNWNTIDSRPSLLARPTPWTPILNRPRSTCKSCRNRRNPNAGSHERFPRAARHQCAPGQSLHEVRSANVPGRTNLGTHVPLRNNSTSLLGTR
jgi:hypothetical protein